MSADGVGRRIESVVARYFDGPVPAADGLPRYVAPLPSWLEDVALRLAWPIAVVNLAGTVFGFWYYGFHPWPATDPLVTGQFGMTPPVAWPLVPDSPVATLFIGLSFAAYRLDWDAEPIHALAFFGCLKLGLWTPFVQLALNGPEGIAAWLYYFLIVSHLAMAIEAFVIHRYARLSVPAVAVALAWHGGNDVVDYFWPVLDGPHHTILRAEYVDGTITHAVVAHDLAAACAVVLTFLATFLALATRVEKERTRVRSGNRRP